MKLKITVTKDIIRKAMWCGMEKEPGAVNENCAVALAIKNGGIKAISVTRDYIRFVGTTINDQPIYTPKKVGRFIKRFDELLHYPERRLDLPELTFEVDLPEELISQINIEDINKSETLELE